jgi:hypothetical protein
MTAARRVTATAVAIFTTGNLSRTWRPVVTAHRCGCRTSRTLGSAVIGQLSRDQRRVDPALRRPGRGGI